MAVDKQWVRTRPSAFHDVERFGLAVALACAALFCLAASASAGPAATRLVYAPGKIVPIPAAIPHEAGDMVDQRILPDLAGSPSATRSTSPTATPAAAERRTRRLRRMPRARLRPLQRGRRRPGAARRRNQCDAAWAPITRLALWAEPVQNQPVPPFRWVGYEGDAGHGCGNHLHLSWNHAPAPQFQLAEWVEVFPVGPGDPASQPPRKHSPPAPKAPPGPSAGISPVHTGGLGVHGVGD